MEATHAPGQLVSVSPATGEEIGGVPVTSAGEVEAVVADVAEVQPFWAQVPVAHRARFMRRAAQVVIDDLDGLATLLAREQGKPRTESYTTELLPTVDALHWIADNGPKLLRDERIATTQVYFLTKRARVVREPLGVIGVIAPWANPWAVPLGQIAVALMCGNGVVLKTSEHTPLVGERLRAVLERAGFPEGLVRVVHGGAETAEAVAAAYGVAKVFFTGGREEGRRVGALCGERGRSAVLDLGGKDPQLVLEDADLEHAVAGALWAGFANAGQSGAGIKRIYVPRARAEWFVDALVRGADELTVGDPLRWDTEIGPLVSAAHRSRVAAQVEEAVGGGAEVRFGGPLAGRRGGAFFTPTVLTGVTPDMAVLREDVCGPVVSVVAVDSEEEAVSLAGAPGGGLSASVWTRDRARGERIARRLDCGTVWLNEHVHVPAAMQWPWGGTGASGTGRSFGRLGFEECVSRKLLAWEPSLRRDAWWFPYDEALGRAAEATAKVLYGRDDDKLDALRSGVGPLARVLDRVLRDAPPR